MKITYWISRVIEGGKPVPVLEFQDRDEAYKALSKITFDQAVSVFPLICDFSTVSCG